MKKIICTILSIFLLTSVVCSSDIKNKPVYSCNENIGNKIALTFDDGPHPKITPKILEILDKYNVKATFFVIGINAKNYPETLSMVANKGHQIGNHTYSHKSLKSISKDIVCKEISTAEDEIMQNNIEITNILRPPGGLYDQTLIDVALEKNYKIVLWNIDTHDWAHASDKAIIKNVINNVKGGDIILFHDYISGRVNTISALEKLIPKLQSMGYEFVTVSELLQ